ncbi:unnamed protein product [Durusdinium trenchii]|uniref:Uncharacterized protein n=1 Tax=Durusdinium trenchii TaxID=1381693 RepID=A0ABP0LSX4_9DINO
MNFQAWIRVAGSKSACLRQPLRTSREAWRPCATQKGRRKLEFQKTPRRPSATGDAEAVTRAQEMGLPMRPGVCDWLCAQAERTTSNRWSPHLAVMNWHQEETCSWRRDEAS